MKRPLYLGLTTFLVFYFLTGIAFAANEVQERLGDLARAQARVRVNNSAEPSEIEGYVGRKLYKFFQKNGIFEPEIEEHSSGVLATLAEVGSRIVKSNNRSLGTLFGCIAGGIVGVVLVTSDYQASFPIFGNPRSTVYQIGGVLLAAGAGGNLSSYIGASIDIITGEKTVFDLIKYLANLCCAKKQQDIDEVLQTVREPIEHHHFPFVTSSNAALREHIGFTEGEGHHQTILTSEEILEALQSVYHSSKRNQAQMEELIKENRELKAVVESLRQQDVTRATT